MRTRVVIWTALAGLGLVAGLMVLTAARRGDRIDRVDFDKVVDAGSGRAAGARAPGSHGACGLEPEWHVSWAWSKRRQWPHFISMCIR